MFASGKKRKKLSYLGGWWIGDYHFCVFCIPLEAGWILYKKNQVCLDNMELTVKQRAAYTWGVSPPVKGIHNSIEKSFFFTQDTWSINLIAKMPMMWVQASKPTSPSSWGKRSHCECRCNIIGSYECRKSVGNKPPEIKHGLYFLYFSGASWFKKGLGCTVTWLCWIGTPTLNWKRCTSLLHKTNQTSHHVYFLVFQATVHKGENK